MCIGATTTLAHWCNDKCALTRTAAGHLPLKLLCKGEMSEGMHVEVCERAKNVQEQPHGTKYSDGQWK